MRSSRDFLPPAPGDIERHVQVDEVPIPPGPFAWSVAYGGLVFVSGLRGIDPATGLPAADDEQRVALIFQYLERILAAQGCTLADILTARVYVTDMSRHRPLVNAVFQRFLGESPPARTIVQVAALNQGDSIEIEVVAGRRAGQELRRQEGRVARRKRGQAGRVRAGRAGGSDAVPGNSGSGDRGDEHGTRNFGSHHGTPPGNGPC
jgi:2-iminobutanoate/2-iminopropanoate deaminase